MKKYRLKKGGIAWVTVNVTKAVIGTASFIAIAAFPMIAAVVAGF